jgi:hypothetical protein
MDEWFFITLAGLGFTGARAQDPVGWKEICAVVERSLSIGIQIRLPCRCFLLTWYNQRFIIKALEIYTIFSEPN